MGVAGQKDLSKCRCLFLGCVCALGKPGYCSSLGETRQGLGWFGFRGAGCWICAVGVVLGWFPLQGLGVASQGSRALKTCFTRHFTAELWFWAAVRKTVLMEEKGTWVHGRTAVPVVSWDRNDRWVRQCYTEGRGAGPKLCQAVCGRWWQRFRKWYVDVCPWLLKKDKGLSCDHSVSCLSLLQCSLGINVRRLCLHCGTLLWCYAV